MCRLEDLKLLWDPNNFVKLYIYIYVKLNLVFGGSCWIYGDIALPIIFVQSHHHLRGLGKATPDQTERVERPTPYTVQRLGQWLGLKCGDIWMFGCVFCRCFVS